MYINVTYCQYLRVNKSLQDLISFMGLALVVSVFLFSYVISNQTLQWKGKQNKKVSFSEGSLWTDFLCESISSLKVYFEDPCQNMFDISLTYFRATSFRAIFIRTIFVTDVMTLNEACCHTRFQRAFTSCVCDFRVIALIWSNQCNNFKNANACWKRLSQLCLPFFSCVTVLPRRLWVPARKQLIANFDFLTKTFRQISQDLAWMWLMARIRALSLY